MIRLDDPALWGNEAAEDEEPGVLSSYFVSQPQFQPFFDEGVRLSIARARKGMGKSALVCECEQRAGNGARALAIHLKGADLVAQRPIRDVTANEHIHDWQQRICMCINHRLGSEIGLATNDDELLLVESAELAGYKRRNLVSSLVTRLQGKLGPVTLGQIEARDHRHLLKRIVGDGDWRIWVLVDDIDATFVDTPEACLRISTFFSACRDLATAFHGINVRTCIRSDVWTSICRVDESLDKCEQYMLDIQWSNRQMGAMLAERIASYLRRRGLAGTVDQASLETGDVMDCVFARRFPWGRSRVAPHRVLHVFAGGRPRWAMQLSRMAGSQAMAAKSGTIKFGHLKQCLDTYGRRRLDDLAREHQHQCPQVGAIANAFSKRKVHYSTDEITEFVDETVLAKLEVQIDGRAIDDALEIVRFLFRAGFILGVDTQAKSARYYQFEEKPELLKNYANLDDGLGWCIQPAFHAALGLGR